VAALAGALTGVPHRPSRYPVPAARHRSVLEERRSRFIATLAPAPELDEARAFIARIRTEFPDATHHCWAYVVGAPGETAAVGLSDDGEPHGTAGRPILNALLHSGVGDVAAVVTRYYGGVKLGTGGLARAYGGAVQQALATLPRRERVERVTVRLTVEYAAVAAVQRLFPAHEVEVLAEEWGAEARFRLQLPAERLDAFRAALLDLTSGRAVIKAEG
jgi:uncharacterized YigZ family protein